MAMAPRGKAATLAAAATPRPPLCAEGKENVAPDGERGLVGSPLPEGFPRRPLQDITGVLELESNNVTEKISIACTARTARGKEGIAFKTTTRKIKERTRCKSKNGLEQVVLVTSSNAQQAESEAESQTVRKEKQIKQCRPRNGLEQVILVTSPKTQQAEGVAEDESPTAETLDDTKQDQTPSSATVECEQTTNGSRQGRDEEKNEQTEAAAADPVPVPAHGANDERQDAGLVLQGKKRKSQAHPQTATAAKPKQISSSSSILKFR